jgi:predicted GNAT family N-acyltransferase
MDTPEIPIRWATGPADVRAALALREQVFCGEQGVPASEELDGHDDRAHHLVALEGGDEGVIGTLRLLVAGGVAKVGRVAVRSDWRHRGVASHMLELAILRARELGCDRARLASQVYATSLYERAGFVVESDVFEEAGMPHVWMGRALAPGRAQGAPPR